MTRDGLIRGAWDAKTSAYGSGPVRDMMRGLRRKLGDNGSIPGHSFTEPRDGHRMEKRETREQGEPE